MSAAPPAGGRCSGIGLLSPAEALSMMLRDVAVVPEVETVGLLSGTGRITAREIRSPIALPRFDNAAMDGFAIHADDLGAPLPMRLALGGRIPAGAPRAVLRAGEALAINTGAWIPHGTGAVVERERASAEGGRIILEARPAAGRNVRRAGEDLREGDRLVAAGTLLDERHIALLGACGIAEATVRRRLRIGVLSTGSELVPPGAPVPPGRIVDVNRRLLAALVQFAGPPSDLGIANDTLPDLVARLSRARDLDLDLLITSGGVAGSDADLVQRAVTRLGGETTTLSLALKPGKPVGFGRIGRCVALHVAGNPMAAIAGGLLFARPLAAAMTGLTGAGTSHPAHFAEAVPHRAGRTELVPARIVRHEAGRAVIAPLGRGGSASLSPLVAADGMAEIPPDLDDVEPGREVEFHRFADHPFVPRGPLWRAT